MQEIQVPRSLWPDYLKRIESKTAIKAGITAAISFFAGVEFTKFLNRSDILVSGLWCVVTAIVVLQPHLGGTYKAAWQRFLGLLIGSALGVIFTLWFGASAILLGISVACTVAICSILNLTDSFRIAAMSVAVIMLSWGAHPETPPWMLGLYRFLDSCLGILIAVIVTHTLWPAQATFLVQTNTGKCLNLLNRLYLSGADIEGKEQLNKTIRSEIQDLQELLHENHDALEDSKLELMIKREDTDHWKTLYSLCSSLFEKVLTLHNIDKHLLSLIVDDDLSKNLRALVEETDSTIKTLAKHLEKNEPMSQSVSTSLTQTLQSLKTDLIRYRGTKTTRKFELKDVEGFFVFFYTIEAIAEQIPLLEENVKKAINR